MRRAPRAGGVNGIFIDASTVEVMMTRAQAKISEPAIAAWLTGPMQTNLRARAQERFATEGTDDGPWEPLKDATLSWRAASGYPPGPINRRSGEMERYITGATGRVFGGAGTVTMEWPGEVPGGLTGKKVATAQAGDPGTNTPARQVIGLGMRDLEFALLSFHTWFTMGGAE